jgi:hypothetical protein
MNIFISHASDMLTDCRPDGDGLIADRARGHAVHVAVDRNEVRSGYPSDVRLRKIETGSSPDGLTCRFRFAFGVRSLLSRPSSAVKFDVIHELNPVVTGLSLAFWGIQVPIVLSPYVPDWPLVLAMLSLTIGVSCCTYRFIEQPGIALGKRLYTHFKAASVRPAMRVQAIEDAP